MAAKKSPTKSRKTTKRSATKSGGAKKPAAKKATKKAPAKAASSDKSLRGAAAAAAEILGAEDSAAVVSELAAELLDSRKTNATRAARILHELVEEHADLLTGHVDKFAAGMTAKHPRVTKTAADALPAIAKIQPARVAKHLDTLKASFDETTQEGKDGLVRTFANLCTASVAYQKRLEPVLVKALEGCDGKTLRRWSEIVLPALKGEPHANAKEVVEARLDKIPRSIAQDIASSLNIRLRVRYR